MILPLRAIVYEKAPAGELAMGKWGFMLKTENQ